MIGFCGVWCVYDILIGSLWPTRLLWQNHFYAPRDLACHFDVPFRFKAISDMAYQRNREALGFDHCQLYPISELTSALWWGLERKWAPVQKAGAGTRMNTTHTVNRKWRLELARWLSVLQELVPATLRLILMTHKVEGENQFHTECSELHACAVACASTRRDTYTHMHTYVCTFNYLICLIIHICVYIDCKVGAQS